MEANDKRKQEEPFRPEDTPTPPQVQDPSRTPEGNQPEAKTGEQRKSPKENKPGETGEKIQDTGKRLGESPLEIDDETTI